MLATNQPSADRGRRRKGEATAERILDAAETLFAEGGFAGTTLRDVASKVGLRNPSLYNHFDSKEALYAAVLARGIGPVLDALTEVLEAGPEAYEHSSQIIVRVMDLLSEHPRLPRLILHEIVSGGQHLTPMLRDWITPTFARAYEMVEVLPAARHWQAEQIPLLVLALYHIVVGYFTIAPFYHELGGEDLLTPEALKRQTEFLTRLVEAVFSAPGETTLSTIPSATPSR